MGGRKTLMSGRVMSSGYIPPVSSNKARRRRLSELLDELTSNRRTERRINAHIPNRSATPGKYQTGSTAAFDTFISTPDHPSLSEPSSFFKGPLFSTIF